MFGCEIPGMSAAAHAWHLVLHIGLAGLVSSVGSGFLVLGVLAHRRRPLR